MKRKKTRDALKIIRRDVGDDPEFDRNVEDELFKMDIAQALYDARTAAGLTQTQLAERVGTSQPGVARLEDTDYEGHSLSMIRRVADALDMNVELRLVPRRKRGRRSRRKK